MEEHWKEIPGYEGVYSVSNQGQVRRDLAGPSTYVGRLLSTKRASGYVQAVLCNNAISRAYKVHRLVAEAFLGPRPPGADEINHLSGDKSDNRAKNLEWTTRQGNMDHARKVLKSLVGNPKLKERDAPRIRGLYATGQYSQTDLGRLYGVSYRTIADVVYGRTWGHVGGPIQVSGFRKGKLTRESVLAIRRLHSDGMTMTAIAQEFDVSISLVSRIVRRKTWASLPEAKHE